MSLSLTACSAKPRIITETIEVKVPVEVEKIVEVQRPHNCYEPQVSFMTNGELYQAFISLELALKDCLDSL